MNVGAGATDSIWTEILESFGVVRSQSLGYLRPLRLIHEASVTVVVSSARWTRKAVGSDVVVLMSMLPVSVLSLTWNASLVVASGASLPSENDIGREGRVSSQ